MTEKEKFPIPTGEQEDIEEALGFVWHEFFEEKKHGKEMILPALRELVGESVVDRMLKRDLLTISEERLALTVEGERLARDIIRRHRLAERLLSDVLELEAPSVDSNACRLEHIVSPEVAESICALLGHPKQCPHGSAIPAGACCQRERESEAIEPVVVSLNRMKAGEGGKIAYVLLHNHPELHKLLALGVVPGTTVRLHQSFPAFVLDMGETQLALEEAVARNIFVRRLKNV